MTTPARKKHGIAAILAAATFGLLTLGLPCTSARAADHADSPAIAQDSGADIADVFAFLDPHDNSKVVLIYTLHGFITPGEALNFSIFDPNVRYRLNIENTGDTKIDKTIDITFSPKTGATAPQTATVKFSDRKKAFTAPTTPSTEEAEPVEPTITTDPETGVKFFAGESDDPFFFDIPGFNRFTDTVRAGHPDVSKLTRGRDSFAGYNLITIALEMPVSMLKGPNSNIIGVYGETDRKTLKPSNKGGVTGSGPYKPIDRMGNPAVNVVLIPYVRKSEYNAATPKDDSHGRFASDVVASLKTYGTDDAHIQTLATIAVFHGDMLRLDTSIPNTGSGGGDNPQAAYPNGRRLKDDTVDIILEQVNNGSPLGDHVDANDVPLRDEFPFVAPPQQPREPGVLDDNTRN